jgi:hypothetical protein
MGMPARALSQILEVGNLSSAALPPRLDSHAADEGCTGRVSMFVAFRKWSAGCVEHWPIVGGAVAARKLPAGTAPGVPAAGVVVVGRGVVPVTAGVRGPSVVPIDDPSGLTEHPATSSAVTPSPIKVV